MFSRSRQFLILLYWLNIMAVCLDTWKPGSEFKIRYPAVWNYHKFQHRKIHSVLPTCRIIDLFRNVKQFQVLFIWLLYWRSLSHTLSLMDLLVHTNYHWIPLRVLNIFVFKNAKWNNVLVLYWNLSVQLIAQFTTFSSFRVLVQLKYCSLLLSTCCLFCQHVHVLYVCRSFHLIPSNFWWVYNCHAWFKNRACTGERIQQAN